MDIIWNDRKRLLLFGLPWTFTKYTCTSEKFILESGVFSTKEEEIRLYRIMDLTLERSFLQRIFGLGTIICDTVDKSTPKLYIQNIKGAKQVKEMLSEAVEAERVKSGYPPENIWPQRMTAIMEKRNDAERKNVRAWK